MLFAAFSDETNQFLAGLILLLLFANAIRKTGRFISNNPVPAKIVGKGIWSIISSKLK